MAEATLTRAAGEYYLSDGADASVSAGEVWLLPSGEVGVYPASKPAVSSGAKIVYETTGKFTFPKSTSTALLAGGRAYWDVSASEVTYKPVNDGDYYLGLVVEDVVAADAQVVVDINKKPKYKIDLQTSPFNTILVGTPAAGGFGYPVRLGGRHVLELTATNEAQKVDLLSVQGVDLSRNPIVEFIFSVMSDGSNATQDFSIGLASGTHASDFQTITSFVAVSTVGNSTNINVQSDDNSADVAPTDTTYDYTEGTGVTSLVEGWLDFRNPADVKAYINGVITAVATLTAGTSGTHYLIAHLEKSSSTDVYKVGVDRLCARVMEQ